jgi:putative ABC transport system permease protein
MIGYYLDLARRSLRKNFALTILMILAIAFGVGASMTTLTVMHVLSSDPLPGKSQHIYTVQLEPRPSRGYTPGEQPPWQMTRFDSETLWKAKKADRQALMTGGNAAIEPQRAGLAPFFVEGRWTTADFFPMFRVPFLAGTHWNTDDDLRAARVAVIAKPLAEKLFGTIDAVGKTIRIEGQAIQVVGVIDHWVPTPHFYDLATGSYGVVEQLFLPFSTSIELKLDRSGNMNCWGDQEGDSTALNAPCDWLQYWVELDSPEKADAYRDYLVAYSEEQRKAGRFQRPPNVRLRDVMEWLEYREVVDQDAKLQMYVALGFLLVCLINTIGLLLTKFLRRSSEIGVRRALGASKLSIFTQLLVEAGSIGLIGGVLGLGLAYLGLWAIRQMPVSYAELAQLDTSMLIATFGLSIASSLLAGLLPAWRGCQVTPALQLKSH